MKNDVVDALFTQHYGGALVYCLSLCGDRTLAEELVSEAFYKALMSADQSIVSFRPWLLTVCRNLYYSRKRRHTHVAFEEQSHEADNNPLEGILQDERYTALYHAISLLDAPYREAVTMHYFEDLRIKEIAEVMGKSENNIKVILYRAREQLKKYLEKHI